MRIALVLCLERGCSTGRSRRSTVRGAFDDRVNGQESGARADVKWRVPEYEYSYEYEAGIPKYGLEHVRVRVP